MQSVERITLKDLMPNASAVLRQLFKEITIQEPTFRDVVILYRRDAKSQIHEAKDTVLLKDAKPVCAHLRLEFLLRKSSTCQCALQSLPVATGGHGEELEYQEVPGHPHG